jgi:cyclic pyranopterin phosphate synthase
MLRALPILDPGPVRPSYAVGPRSLEAVRLLRLSITDRCNLRCVYCMPQEGVGFADRADLLSARDFLTVAQAAAWVGVTHFKLTGGEPTVRSDLPEIVEGLAALSPADLSMTTNGLLLGPLAATLRRVGLKRVTVSWDTMREERFARIARGQGRDGRAALGLLREGVEEAQRVGLGPIKINVVVLAGVNDDEAEDFAALTLDRPWTVRFIEYMPLGESSVTRGGACGEGALGEGLGEGPGEGPGEMPTEAPGEASYGAPVGGCTVDNAVLRRRIERRLGPLRELPRELEPGVGPAEVFQLDGARGRIGFISAMSRPFCESCNRLRLTATGELRSCLFEGGEVEVLPLLREAGDADVRRERLVEAMRRCVAMKPAVHGGRGNRAMSQMGG